MVLNSTNESDSQYSMEVRTVKSRSTDVNDQNTNAQALYE